MSIPYYYYTLRPLEHRKPDKYGCEEIDLNSDAAYSLFFPPDADNEEQRKRFGFIGSYPDLMNAAAHFLDGTDVFSQYTSVNFEMNRIYDDIVKGGFGDFPVSFFKKQRAELYQAQEKILYCLARKNKSSIYHNYFENVLSDIFGKHTVFYFDNVKNILHISFIQRGNDDNRRIFEVCRYFFADMLLKYDVHWNCYPILLDRPTCIITDENEQICGNII